MGYPSSVHFNTCLRDGGLHGRVSGEGAVNLHRPSIGGCLVRLLLMLIPVGPPLRCPIPSHQVPWLASITRPQAVNKQHETMPSSASPPHCSGLGAWLVF